MIEQFEAFFTKLSKNEKVLFVVAFVGLVIVIMDTLVLGPILSQIKVLDVEIVTKSEMIKRDLRLLTFKDGILTQYADYISYMDSGEKSAEEIISSLLKKIETIAIEKSVGISNQQVGEASQGSIFQEYKTSLQGEGTLLNVLGFMHALEQSDYLFRVTKYNLAPKSKGADVIKFTMDMGRVLVMVDDEASEALKTLQAESPKPEEISEAAEIEMDVPADAEDFPLEEDAPESKNQKKDIPKTVEEEQFAGPNGSEQKANSKAEGGGEGNFHLDTPPEAPAE